MSATNNRQLAQSFATTFAGTAVGPADPGYDSARAIWNGTIDAKPALIARWRTTEEIVTAVALTRAAGVPLAVRGGGHSVAGLSTCDGGVVIDLCRCVASMSTSAGARRRFSQGRPGLTSTPPPRRLARR